MRSGSTSDAVAARVLIRTEGQRMLMAVSGSLAAIAQEVGAKTGQTVHAWRTGAKLPSTIARARMQTALGIPARAWSVLPGGALDPPPDATPEAASAPPSTLEHVMKLLAVIERDRMQDGLMPSERVKLAMAEARILEIRARLEDAAQFAEARYVTSHPAWLKLKRVILQALEPHAAAACAVADAIARMEANGHADNGR